MPRKISKPGVGLSKLGQNAQGKRRWLQIPTKLQKIVQNNLGIIMTDQMSKYSRFRSEDLDTFDQYYEGNQYDGLIPWEDAAMQEDYVAVRKRKPRINYNVAKVLVNKVAGKLIGSSVFPKFVVEDDPEDTEFFRAVMKAASFQRNMLEPIKHMLLSGAAFVRYYLVDGIVEMEWANAKYCYPQFDAVGELEQIEIKYVFEDPNDKTANGKFRQKWYRMVLTKNADILYDNPEYREGTEPTFQEVERNEHGFNFVQGEWFRTAKHKFDPDGDSLIGDILDFIDDLNYSLSQSSQAISYNQEPLLGVSGLDSEEIDKVVRSSQKALSLGREGEAAFIESDLKGVEVAEENRDHNRHRMLEVVRIVLHDPEKIVGSAMSAKAMETLHAPLVELIDELRIVVEPSLRNLLLKISMTLLQVNAQGFETMITVPKGWSPHSLDLTVQWPAIFPLTIEDIAKKCQAAGVVTTNKIISRESALRWLAADFGIEDIDTEIQKIAAEPDLNPFPAF